MSHDTAWATTVAACAALAVPAVAAAASAPGAPGARTTWTGADKDGFGTAIGRGSKVWFTLSRGRLSEVFAPRLDTPSVRDLELVVSDGRTFAERESAATTHAVGMIPEQVWDARAPSGREGFAPGEATFSATPLAWSHAVLVRLAWSIEAGHPLERPAVVACRHTGNCVS